MFNSGAGEAHHKERLRELLSLEKTPERGLGACIKYGDRLFTRQGIMV